MSRTICSTSDFLNLWFLCSEHLPHEVFWLIFGEGWNNTHSTHFTGCLMLPSHLLSHHWLYRIAHLSWFANLPMAGAPQGTKECGLWGSHWLHLHKHENNQASVWFLSMLKSRKFIFGSVKRNGTVLYNTQAPQRMKMNQLIKELDQDSLTPVHMKKVCLFSWSKQATMHFFWYCFPIQQNGIEHKTERQKTKPKSQM